MRPRVPQLSFRVVRLSIWLGAATLAFALFVSITHKLLEADVSDIDRTILVLVGTLRTPWLNPVAVDLTALGSATLVVLISVVSLYALLILGDRVGALQLLIACGGAGILTYITKNFIERTRPEEVIPLVQVSGSSYPSGHSLLAASLYLTVAILVGRHLRRSADQTAIVVMATVIILLVGASRVYLGVHYPSDVASGTSLGVAWALLLTACFSFIRKPSPRWE